MASSAVTCWGEQLFRLTSPDGSELQNREICVNSSSSATCYTRSSSTEPACLIPTDSEPTGLIVCVDEFVQNAIITEGELSCVYELCSYEMWNPSLPEQQLRYPVFAVSSVYASCHEIV